MSLFLFAATVDGIADAEDRGDEEIRAQESRANHPRGEQGRKEQN